MNRLKKIIIIIIFLIIYMYVCNIACLPSQIVLFEGEKINVKTILGLSIQAKGTDTIMPTSTNL